MKGIHEFLYQFLELGAGFGVDQPDEDWRMASRRNCECLRNYESCREDPETTSMQNPQSSSGDGEGKGGYVQDGENFQCEQILSYLNWLCRSKIAREGVDKADLI